MRDLRRVLRNVPVRLNVLHSTSGAASSLSPIDCLARIRVVVVSGILGVTLGLRLIVPMGKESLSKPYGSPPVGVPLPERSDNKVPLLDEERTESCRAIDRRPQLRSSVDTGVTIVLEASLLLDDDIPGGSTVPNVGVAGVLGVVQ